MREREREKRKKKLRANLYNGRLRGEKASIVEEVVELQRRAHDDQFERQRALRADAYNAGEEAD